MINKLLTLLRSPYPSLVKRWKSVIIPSLIVFLILFVLQPFGISMMEGYKFWVVLGYGVVSSLALSISTYLFPALFPRYHSEKNWTLGRELLGTLGACLLIAIGNCFYTAWVFGSFILSWKGFLISLAWVAVLAPFPIIFFLMWNRNLQLVRNLKEATEINYALAKRENTQKEKIRTRNEEQIGEGRAAEEVAEEAVAACSFIVRCHRAFLVNIRTVVKVDGNSQGYRLKLEGCTEEVPVSRGYAKEIKTLIEGGAEG